MIKRVKAIVCVCVKKERTQSKDCKLETAEERHEKRIDRNGSAAGT